MEKSASSPFLNLGSTATVAASSSASNLLALAQEDDKSRKTVIPAVPFVSERVQIGNINGCLHSYDPESTYSGTPPKALVVFLHGWNAHGTFPTTKIVAQLMLKNGYAFMAPDLPGHGHTSGPRGYMESGERMIDFASKMVDHAYREYLKKASHQKLKQQQQQQQQQPQQSPGLKLFVIGSSMGGNLALHCALRSRDISGVILLAPMLKHALVSPLNRMLLQLSAKALPKAKVVPFPRNKHNRCPHVNQEVERDSLKPYQFGNFVQLQSLATLVQLTDLLEPQMKDVSFPCLVMVGDEDGVVDNQGAVALACRARSKDITLKRYPALHALMAEPSPLLEVMQEDMIKWMGVRCATSLDLRSSL